MVYKVKVKQWDGTKLPEGYFHSGSLQYHVEGAERTPVELQFQVLRFIANVNRKKLINGKSLEISVKLE